MVKSLETQLDPLDGWMATLPGVSDPARLRLLRLLERQELGVAELCDVVQMPQSTVSRHLKLLADEGWISSRRSGTTNLYRMILDEISDPARSLWLLARKQTEAWATVEQDRIRLAERLKQRRDQSRSFFANAARDWVNTRHTLYGHGFMQHAFAALLPTDWTVADLGCGTGQTTVQLAASVNRVIGIDNSDAMLAAAQHNTANFDNIDLREGDLEALPIDDHTCDAALLSLVLTYMPDVEPSLAEASRILTPTGKLVIIDLLRHDREDFRRDLGQAHLGFDCDELAQTLTRIGFINVACHPLPPDPAAKGPALLLAIANQPSK